MDWIDAVILGTVQGITEFLPISSTAHLLVMRTWMGHSHPEDALTVVIQMGSIAAVLAYFRDDIATLLRAAWHDLCRRRWGRSLESRLCGYILLGTLPAALAGFLGQRLLKEKFFNIPAVAVVSMVFAMLMAAGEWWQQRRFRRHGGHRPLSELNWRDALWIGCWQACALMPGGSRSGTTITGGLLAGFDRSAATRFSFLLSLPVILTAGLKEIYDEYVLWKTAAGDRPSLFASQEQILALIVGLAVSAIVSYATIAFLLQFVRRHSLYPFAVYRLVLGTVLLILVGLKILP